MSWSSRLSKEGALFGKAIYQPRSRFLLILGYVYIAFLSYSTFPFLWQEYLCHDDIFNWISIRNSSDYLLLSNINSARFARIYCGAYLFQLGSSIAFLLIEFAYLISKFREFSYVAEREWYYVILLFLSAIFSYMTITEILGYGSFSGGDISWFDRTIGYNFYSPQHGDFRVLVNMALLWMVSCYSLIAIVMISISILVGKRITLDSPADGPSE